MASSAQRRSGSTMLQEGSALRYLGKCMEEERQQQEQGFKNVRFDVLCVPSMSSFACRHLKVPPGFSPPAQDDVTGPGVASGSNSA